MARKVLVQFIHPAVEKSRVNVELARVAQEVPGVTFRDLYELYPDLQVDVKKEQEQLLAHDVIVFQHPFYWYSAPALLKEWCDLVLEFGWAYGEGGERLEGKAWAHAITTGGPAHAYATDGYNRYPMRQYLLPFDQTAYLCGMEFLEPHVEHGVLRIRGEKPLEEMRARYRTWLDALVQGAGM